MTFVSLTGFAVDPETAYKMVQKGDAILIDIREMKELDEGIIDRAAWFPMSQIRPGTEVIKDFKNFSQGKKVFVYCQGGKRAATCQQLLKKEGIDAESIGGFNELKKILPTKKLYQRINVPYETEASNRTRN